MRVRIYQIDPNRDSERLKFRIGADGKGQEEAGPIPSSIYNEVFDGELPESNLEELYRRFNMESHPLFRGHSLSVSDVVVTPEGAFLCDMVGFHPVEFDESQTEKPDNLMKVVYVEPGMPAYEAEIVSTLSGEQQAVGGYIEPIYLGDGICLVGNEEAKLMGLPGNRHVGNAVIAGNFFLCGEGEEDFRSLTPQEVAENLERFAQPEEISQQEVQADMGFTIYMM